MITSSFSSGRIVRAGLLGILLAVVLNVALYYLFVALGYLDRTFIVNPESGQPVTAGAVAGATALPLLLATGLFWLLARFTRRPVLIFGSIVGVFLLGSLMGPFSIPNVPQEMAIALNVMHVVAAGVIFLALRRSVPVENQR
jgi:hypothetical protein